MPTERQYRTWEEQACRIVESNGECHNEWSCDACLVAYFIDVADCEAGTANELATEFLHLRKCENNYKDDIYSDPIVQAKAIIDNDGNCPFKWQCNKCIVSGQAELGSCSSSVALFAAKNILEGRIGICKSIWNE